MGSWRPGKFKQSDKATHHPGVQPILTQSMGSLPRVPLALPRLGPRKTTTSSDQSPGGSARGLLRQMPFSRGCWNEMVFSELIQRGTTRWRQTPAMPRSDARQGPPPAQTSLCLRVPAPVFAENHSGLLSCQDLHNHRKEVTHWHNFGGPAANVTRLIYFSLGRGWQTAVYVCGLLIVAGSL